MQLLHDKRNTSQIVMSVISKLHTHHLYLPKRNVLTEFMYYIPDVQNGLFLHLDCLLYNFQSHKPIGDK